MLSTRAHFRSGFILPSFRIMPYKTNHQGLRETFILIKQILPVNSQASLRTKLTNNNSITKVNEVKNNQISVATKVKQATKDVSYLSIIIIGISITGVMFYAVLSELFSKQSPNAIYSDAFKICRNDPKIIDAIGEPIKGYGELSSRGRRRHVNHFSYIKDDVNYMRMKFYIEGSRRRGTVQLEVKREGKKAYEYRYLFVDLEGYPQQSIILKDNRYLDKQ